MPAARKDIELAITWDEERSLEVAERFKYQVVNEIDALQNDLLEYGIVYQGLSRAFMKKKYPYFIYFKDAARQLIIIYAIFYKSQDRSILSGRL